MPDILKLFFSILLFPFHQLLKAAIAKAKIKALELPLYTDMIASVPTSVGNKAWVTTQITSELELDFLNYRSETYIRPMSYGIAAELSLLIRGKNRAEPTTEDALVNYLLNGSGANACHYDAVEKAYVAEFSTFHFEPWPSSPLGVSKFVFDPASNRYEVHGKNGKVYRPADPNWKTALDHVNATLTIGLPAAFHNWVHFSLLEAIGEQAYQLLPRRSVLSQLLAPHLRFTNRINQQALWTRKSTNAKNTLAGKLVPWHAFPMNGPEFADGVLINTGDFYKDLSFLNKPEKLDLNVPYFVFLKGYFDVIERFVERVMPAIDRIEISKLLQGLNGYYPGIATANPVRVLSMAIWLAAVYHYTDHATYCDFARKYGLNRTAGPLEQVSKGDATSRYERFRLRSFVNIFGGFNPNPRLNQSITNILSYGFEVDSVPGKAAEAFLQELKALDQSNYQKGMQIVPCQDMVQSVCF